jgi:hypothetical protein
MPLPLTRRLHPIVIVIGIFDALQTLLGAV